MRSAFRLTNPPYARYDDTGLRLVRYLTPPVSTDDPDFPGQVIDRIFGVSNTAEWIMAVSEISIGGNNKNYIINVIGDFPIAGRTTPNFGNLTGIKVSIRGPGRTLTLSGNGNMLRTESGQTLILRDIIWQGGSNNNAPLMYVSGTNSDFIMQSGKISGNRNTYYTTSGGGVYVDNYGTFTMNGGEISGNYAYTEGGGVYVDDKGTFTMHQGGKISGNSAYSGGGVCVCDKGASFTMYGGVISGNKADNTGGGVYVGYLNAANFGTFRIVTGTIYGSNEADTALRNTASSTNNGPALYKPNNGINSMAQYGTFNGATWVSSGDLSTTNNTIRVVNGNLQ
jgi:hypothetical protein